LPLRINSTERKDGQNDEGEEEEGEQIINGRKKIKENRDRSSEAVEASTSAQPFASQAQILS
jgi:hypothetical protein